MNSGLAEQLSQLGFQASSTSDLAQEQARAEVKTGDQKRSICSFRQTDVKLILQFSTPHGVMVPRWLYQNRDETKADHVARKTLPTEGQHLLDRTKHVMLDSLRLGVIEAGFRMVDAFYMRRVNIHAPLPQGGHKTYHMMRYTFHRNPDAESLRPEWQRVLIEHVAPELDYLLTNSLWAARAYRNLAFKGGVQIPGVNAVSLNFEFPVTLGSEQNKKAQTLSIREGRLYLG